MFKGYIYTPMLLGMYIAAALALWVGPSDLLDFIFHGKK